MSRSSVRSGGGVTYLDGEHKGLKLIKGSKVDTHLRLVRRPSGPRRGKCEDAMGEMAS